MQTEDEENLVPSPERLIEDELPPCGRCGGSVFFLGHESPDYWIKSWKAWFKCLACGYVFSEKRKQPLRILFSTKK